MDYDGYDFRNDVNPPYKRIVKKYLMPAFSEIFIEDLKAYHIRDFTKSLCKKTKIIKPNGTLEFIEQPLKIKSIRNILVQLRKVVNRALTDDYITKNPFDNIVLKDFLPKECFESEYDVDPFGLDEIQELLKSLSESQQYMVQFMCFTGVRPSELMALEWRDVNFFKRTVHVSRAFVYKKIKGTKTRSGNREVMLLPPAYDALIGLKKYTFMKSERIFLHPVTNKPWEHDQQLRDWWEGALKRAGLRYRTPYQCRHTFATMMLDKGESVLWIAAQMGHVDTEMVIKTYAIKPKSTDGYQFRHDWGAVFETKSNDYIKVQTKN